MGKIFVISDNTGIRNSLESSFRGWGYLAYGCDPDDFNMDEIIRLSPEAIIVDIYSPHKRCKEICGILKKDFITAGIPLITLIDREQLKSDASGFLQEIDDYLVMPYDPVELRTRIQMAIKRSRHSFYANSLTGLPGGIVIENTLKERIDRDEPFVIGHVDIDNFKSFNDKYGYLKGDRAIMQTAYMLNMAVRRWGNKNDFIGHIGGDDFVIITSPEKYNEVCRNFICMFDTIIPFHYSGKDREKGYIIATDRSDRKKRIPIMSVTIALVLKDGPAEVYTMIELNECIAEVKQYLKKIPGSKYLADRRIAKKNEHLLLQVFKNDEDTMKNYRPLGQILLEKNIITLGQLDNALKEHWKRGVLLGEVLKDLNIITEKDLEEALLAQEDNLE